MGLPALPKRHGQAGSRIQFWGRKCTGPFDAACGQSIRYGLPVEAGKLGKQIAEQIALARLIFQIFVELIPFFFKSEDYFLAV